MRKIIYILFICLICGPLHAATNPFMGPYQNQIALNIGLGVNSGFLIPPPAQFVPFFMLPNIQYSQPTTFFRLPARQSLNFGQTVGMGHKYGWDWCDFSIPILYASEDVILASYHDFYYATGVGVGFQAQQNSRIGTKLLFQFKITLGYKITDRWSSEFFVQHFSNANTNKNNHSYGFWGLGVVYNF